MFFRELVSCNKAWLESTELIIVSSFEHGAVGMRAKSASSVYGDRHVLWFKDDVVMIE